MISSEKIFQINTYLLMSFLRPNCLLDSLVLIVTFLFSIFLKKITYISILLNICQV